MVCVKTTTPLTEWDVAYITLIVRVYVPAALGFDFVDLAQNARFVLGAVSVNNFVVKFL